MKAAVVTNGAPPPRWTDFADPVATENETLVTVAAAALTSLARATASGTHYSASGAASLVAGVDGVGRLADGRRVFFAFPRAPFGAMAERVPIRTDFFTDVPDEVDDVTAAAIGNPGMSSWPALLGRAKLAKGETVLINGATGTAGRLAIQIAKHLGAGRVIATGRNAADFEALRALGADRTILLTLPPERLVEEFYRAVYGDHVAIVLDYLWGTSAEAILSAIARNGDGPVAPRVRFVQLGAVSGPQITLAASTLRGSGVELLGSGLRSVALSRLVSYIGEMLHAVVPAKLTVASVTRPLQEVETAWNQDFGGRRLVFTL